MKEKKVVSFSQLSAEIDRDAKHVIYFFIDQDLFFTVITAHEAIQLLPTIVYITTLLVQHPPSHLMSVCPIRKLPL